MAVKRSGERGSGPITVLLFLGILALVVAIGYTTALAVAGDEGASAQHAADAAALAGAQAVLDDVPDSLALGFAGPEDIAEVLGGGSCLQTGRIEASQLAAANHATLTSYCWNVFRDEISVSAQLTSTSVAGPVSSARAGAATTFDASSCEFPPGFDRPTPSPAPAPGDDDGDPDAPPPSPVKTTVDCGFGALAVQLAPTASLFRFIDLPGALEDVKPRLTS